MEDQGANLPCRQAAMKRFDKAFKVQAVKMVIEE